MDEITGHHMTDRTLLDDLNARVDRLDRNHVVAISVPTTVDVGAPLDTSRHVQQTLALLGERFEGAYSTMVPRRVAELSSASRSP